MVMECKVEEKTRQAVDNAVKQQTRQAVDNAVRQQRDHSRFTVQQLRLFRSADTIPAHPRRKEGLLDVTSTGGVSSLVSPHAYNNNNNNNNNNNGHFCGA